LNQPDDQPDDGHDYLPPTFDSFSLDGSRRGNRAEGPDRPAQPALPRHTGTARRWSMTPLGGDTGGARVSPP
jgi:hypothetical protein